MTTYIKMDSSFCFNLICSIISSIFITSLLFPSTKKYKISNKIPWDEGIGSEGWTLELLQADKKSCVGFFLPVEKSLLNNQKLKWKRQLSFIIITIFFFSNLWKKDENPEPKRKEEEESETCSAL